MTNVFPFPPDEGGKICVYGFVDYLRHFQNIHLFLPVSSPHQKKLVEEMKVNWPSVEIHTSEAYSVQKPSTFNGRLLKTAKTSAYKAKTFIESRTRVSSSPSGNEYPIRPVSPPFSRTFIGDLLKVLKSNRFDIIQMESTPALNIVNIVPNGIKTVFVEMESLHSLIKDYRNLPGIDGDYIEYLSDYAKTAELAFMSKYDAIFALSSSDEEKLSRLLPGKKIYNSSFPVLDKDIAEVMSDDFSIKRIVYMGRESHPPNKDAVVWFAKDILPALKLSDDIEILVTGQWHSKTIKHISSINSSIHFTGFVDDVKPLLKNSISIAPIRLGGGGVRTKLIYAMASNSPVVTTSVGAEGLMGKDENGFMIADTAQEFANSVNAIMSDVKLSEALIRNGQNIVRTYYDQKLLAERRNKFYYEIIGGREYSSM